MTSINTVLPTVTQADLSKDEEAIYRVMHESMAKECLLQLISNSDRSSEAQQEQMRKATRAMLALAQTAYTASLERGVM
ncbi:hypothetical protein Roomu2_00067 [Pseudomonas phage vB_PpuM-Roomu-2]|uniref:Uncharacterized protein n=1 Tax=Pseudomonas phage vB_PpuM-Roomu-2 TaxID=3132621 RepID=A0AAX4MYH2_9CAUD